MCTFPSEESPNEGTRFFSGGLHVLNFFVGGKRPVGLPDINRGKELKHGLYFVSLFDPVTNTPFYSAYTVYPGRQRTLASIRDPKIHIGRILQVRKWLFDNYLLHDRLEHNQSIKQIQRLGVYPALLKNTQRH